MKPQKTIIIGAGASGLMAANILAKANHEVVLLEKKHQCGLKLRITGKGRCNLTNSCGRSEYLSHISSPEFFEYAFDNFNNADLMDFFTEKGVELKTERGGRVFPQSDKANDIFFALLKEIEFAENVQIIKNCDVKHLIKDNGKAIGVIANNEKILADNIIICTGGKSYQTTGSTGDGYRILKLLDHQIITPIPALVGLRTENGYPISLQNLEIKNCQVNITDKDKTIIASHFGDITLDEYGVAGPVILSVSREIARAFDEGKEMFLNIDFKPKVSEERLRSEITATFKERRTENAVNIVRKWVQKPMAEEILRVCKINPRTMGYKLTERDVKSILWYLKFRREEIIGDMGWREAIITQGGVSLKEIDKRTMESKKVKNLYVTGELLDLDADTGGYNLQIAFSSAVLAAQSIITKDNKGIKNNYKEK
ncbi:MAG: NAD(P)/FAD-dependent oxidoreductase [Bacteroidales bacterium]|nr:NAD(P)/FAD-dependent oxidoreductase [Bacteroidales bacterium]